jgi:signal transduction histidine kinase
MRIHRRVGYDMGFWPTLLLLLVAVLIPSISVVWFMERAVVSQRQAARQELMDAYRSQLAMLRDRLEQHWKTRAAALDDAGTRLGAPAAFAHLVAGTADAVIVFDEKGRPLYPSVQALVKPDALSARGDWIRACRLEADGSSRSQREAAAAYAVIASGDPSPVVRARALQARLRCFRRTGDVDAAVRLVLQEFATSAYAQARDSQGRIIAADAELLALELIRRPEDRRFREVLQRLERRLTDYSGPGVPAGQRLFLMDRLRALAPGVDLPTLEGERLAAAFLEKEPGATPGAGMRQSVGTGLWKLWSPSGRVLVLLRDDTIEKQASELGRDLPPGIRLMVTRPGAAPQQSDQLHTVAAGAYLPGWYLSLSGTGLERLDAAPQPRVLPYFWIGFLVVGAAFASTALIAQAIRRQFRLTRLKADLVAAVSHELKTPLSSIQVLVDTLLEDTRFDPVKTREYLELIARENTRLGRVIENFLMFSRIERNRYTFEFTEQNPAGIVDAAADAVRDRFAAPGQLTLDVESDLPPVRADADSLVTALVNLLDNAHKYSLEDKRVILRAHVRDGEVRFEVEDHGIGLSERETKKIFRKFYQADRRLSRAVGGCGLGLSIVQSIVAAHGGSVSVRSAPGKGSTFTIALPAVRAAAKAAAEGARA